MPARDGDNGGWFGGIANEAERYVTERIDRLVASARVKTDELAEHFGERFARHLVEQVAQRLAARLAWALALAGSLVVGIVLLVVGTSGALGDYFGRPWLGQLAAGALTVLVTIGIRAVLVARRRQEARRDKEKLAADAAEAKDSRDRSKATDEAEPALETSAGELGRDVVQSGADFVRRHPVAGALALSAAGLLAGTLLARSNGRSKPRD